jgi:RNA polymerase subunit RPABC4/transcription elongation factor Spt4
MNDLNARRGAGTKPTSWIEPMCFFVAGVQPRTRTVDPTPRRCPQCGLHQAELRRVDHYISLFFIPLFRVKEGEPFLYCRRCERFMADGRGAAPFTEAGAPSRMCRHCGRQLEKGFNYCPNCGQPSNKR